MAPLFSEQNIGTGRDLRQLLHQRLQANSVRLAWYDVALYEHPGEGYLIVRTSGPSGSKGFSETWFRWKYIDALLKYQTVVKKKTNKKRGRIYTPVDQPLFSG